MKLKNENFKLYYLAFSHFLGIGPVKLRNLIKYFGNIKNAYWANNTELKDVIGQLTTNKFIQFRNKFDPEKKLNQLKIKNINVITLESDKYPEELKNISDPPICIYIKGNLDFKNKIFFAIVGTRSPTPYGAQVTRKFSSELATAGFTIVSGLAKGIDTIAHKATVELESKTIAVLGCGVDIVYPAENYFLYKQILEKGGSILSEFPPGQMVVKGLFIARNRIISGMSKGVMVVEGGDHSGALITARYAAEQGKPVFAPPSPINSKMSLAPNLLIKQGARLVTTSADIFEELNMKIVPKRKEDVISNLNHDEKIIFNLLSENSYLIDEISYKLKTSVSVIMTTISELEIKGIIVKNTEKKYEIRL